MNTKKHAAAAAFLSLCLIAAALFAGCGDDSSVPVSNAHSDAQAKGLDGDASGGAVQAGEEPPREEEKLPVLSEEPDEGKLQVKSEAPEVDKPQAKPEELQTQRAEGSAAASGDSESLDEDGDNYFDDAVFIGDSLTEGFQLHGGISEATYYGFKNLNVKWVFEKPLVKSEGGKITIAESLRKNSFNKYYIMLGANELGWVYPQVFTDKYGQLIDLILEENPEAKIYLQSVLPVSEETSRTSKLYSNDRINYYDELIAQLAEEKGVVYLNVREAVENDKGVLPDEAATDGVHLNKDYCLKWADYLRQNK